jgi:hypothetical protein
MCVKRQSFLWLFGRKICGPQRRCFRSGQCPAMEGPSGRFAHRGVTKVNVTDQHSVGPSKGASLSSECFVS